MANAEVDYILSQPPYEYVDTTPEPTSAVDFPFDLRQDFAVKKQIAEVVANAQVAPPGPPIDDFVAINDPQPNGLKSFRCAICGGVYNRKDGAFRKGKWYCTVLECSGETI